MNTRLSPLFYSCLFSCISILALPKVTLAQLRLGTGIQQGSVDLKIDKEANYYRHALGSKSSGNIQNARFPVLSNPYTQGDVSLNRSALITSKDIIEVKGISLAEGIENIGSMLDGTDATLLANSVGANTVGNAIDGFGSRGLAFTGGGLGLAFLALSLFGGGGSGSGSDDGGFVASISGLSAGDTVTTFNPQTTTIRSSSLAQSVSSLNESDAPTINPNALEIPEPSNTKNFLILLSILFLWNRKKIMA